MRLTIVVDVDEDPTIADPYDVAENIVATFNNWAECNGAGNADWIDARWGHHLVRE